MKRTSRDRDYSLPYLVWLGDVSLFSSLSCLQPERMEEDFSYHWFRNIVRSKHGSRKEREREDQFRGYGCSGTCFSLSGSILKQLSGINPCSCLFSPGITIQQVSSLHSIVGHEHQAVSISLEGFWWGSLMKVPACHWWEIWYLTAEPPLPRAFVLFKQQTGAIHVIRKP